MQRQLRPIRWSAAVLFGLLLSLAGCASPGPRGELELATTGGGRLATSEASSPATSPNPTALGSASAVLTIVEFSDYQCSYCRRFHAEVLPALRRTYIDTGKVQLIFKDYPLSQHAEAMSAAIAGRCAAAQAKFWPMNELLFANQAQLGGALYSKLAAALALDVEAFKVCTRDPARRATIERDQKQALSLGINATPGLLIGRMQGERMLVERVANGFVDFVALSAELDKLLAAPVPK